MNWIEVIALLREAGYSQPEIAKACRCGQSTVCDIGKGRILDPRDSIAQGLRMLAAKARRKLSAQKQAA